MDDEVEMIRYQMISDIGWKLWETNALFTMPCAGGSAFGDPLSETAKWSSPRLHAAEVVPRLAIHVGSKTTKCISFIDLKLPQRKIWPFPKINKLSEHSGVSVNDWYTQDITGYLNHFQLVSTRSLYLWYPCGFRSSRLLPFPRRRFAELLESDERNEGQKVLKETLWWIL